MEGLGRPQRRARRQYEATRPSAGGQGLQKEAHQQGPRVFGDSTEDCPMCVTEVTLVTGAWLSTAARESTSLARSVSYEGRTITAGTCQLGRSAPVTAAT